MGFLEVPKRGSVRMLESPTLSNGLMERGCVPAKNDMVVQGR